MVNKLLSDIDSEGDGTQASLCGTAKLRNDCDTTYFRFVVKTATPRHSCVSSARSFGDDRVRLRVRSSRESSASAQFCERYQTAFTLHH